MNKNTTLFLRSALALKCRVLDYTMLDFFIIRFGKHRYCFRGSATPFNRSSNTQLARNKYITNKVLENAGIPVPKAVAITREEYIKGEWSFEDLQYPVVAKPTSDTGLGRDVLCNIKDEKTLHEYLDKTFKKHFCMSIEEFHGDLTCYRVLVFKGKVIGTVERRAAHVVGDGKKNIQQLIDHENIARQQQKTETTMQLISVDQEVKMCLKNQNITLDTVPAKGEEVMLCYTSNSSRGGSIRSLGRLICKENADIAIAAADVLGLDETGLDFLCEDITKPVSKSRGVIVEANHNPDLTIHEHPLEGTPNFVTRTMIRRLIFRHPFGYLSELLHLKKIFGNIFVRVGLLVAIFFIIKHFV